MQGPARVAAQLQAQGGGTRPQHRGDLEATGHGEVADPTASGVADSEPVALVDLVTAVGVDGLVV